MNHLSFLWNEPGCLADVLSEPIVRASVQTLTHGRPVSVTLWHTDGTGVRIQSRMHDIAERLEVGALTFAKVSNSGAEELFIDPMPRAFQSRLKAQKLVLTEGQWIVESGLSLNASDGSELLIVAGAGPFTLAVKGIDGERCWFEPEYPIDRYVVQPLDTA